MNATNITSTTTATTNIAAVTVFGMNFNNAENALREFGFTSAEGEILSAIWSEGINYWGQSCTVREVHGETVLVRDLSLQGYTVLDAEKLMDFYIVEGRTLRGTPRLYALRFERQEDGPAVETWTELHPDTVRTPYATDDDGDERRVVLVRLDDGRVFVKVTGQEAFHTWRSFATRVLDEARKI